MQNILLKEKTQNIFPIIKDDANIFHKGIVLDEAIALLKTEIIESIYPIGSVLIMKSSINPNLLTPGIFWESFGAGKIIVGQGYLDENISNTYIDESSDNKPNGEYHVKLTIDTMPEHTHGLFKVARSSGNQGYDIRGAGTENYTAYAGGSGNHPNLMPYTVVNFWKRVSSQPQGTDLNSFSWGQISQIAAAGKAKEYWSIGDTKIVQTNGNTFLFRIVDFRLEQVEENGACSEGIVFEMVQTIKPNIKFNHPFCSWKNSSIEAYFSDVLLPSLPIDLTNSITPVYKDHLYFDQEAGTTNYTLERAKMTLWFASAKEKGASNSEYVSTNDAVFSYYQTIGATSLSRGKEYLWDQTLTYKELHRSIWSAGSSSSIFNDYTLHTPTANSVSGTIYTKNTSGTAPLEENYWHIAPCFFIGLTN